MYFNDIFPNYEKFKIIVDVLIANYTNEKKVIVEWLDEKKMYSSFKLLFYHLNNYYRNRTLRYSSSVEIWIGLFINTFADASFDLFFKQQAFINNELSTIKDFHERDTAGNTYNVGDNVNNSSETPDKFGGKNTPLTETDNVALRTQNKNTITSKTTTDNYNIIDNLKNLLNYKYRIGINDFVESFNDLFRFFVSGKITDNFSL